MRSMPPGIIERILSLLIPPACREEVLGDLYESCESSREFIIEALRVVPMVVFSRIRRTADPPVLIMHAAVLYLSFLSAAWYAGNTFLFKDSGLLRLAIPPAWVLTGLILDDAYSLPAQQSPVSQRSLLKKIRGPVLGLGLAYLSQLALSTDIGLALPLRVVLFGSVSGLLFSTGLRYLFPPTIDRPAGAGGTAFWLKHAVEPPRIAPELMSVVKTLAWVLVLAFAGEQVGGRRLAAALIFASIFVLIVRELRKRH